VLSVGRPDSRLPAPISSSHGSAVPPPAVVFVSLPVFFLIARQTRFCWSHALISLLSLLVAGLQFYFGASGWFSSSHLCHSEIQHVGCCSEPLGATGFLRESDFTTAPSLSPLKRDQIWCIHFWRLLCESLQVFSGMILESPDQKTR
jgi:hypothetical protein